MMCELKSIYDSRKSFYGKALVVECEDKIKLYSYETLVCEIIHKNNIGKEHAVVYNTYSSTTLRHIKEFLKQNGFLADTKKQIIEDYQK